MSSYLDGIIGGTGLNAYSTLASSFVQPATNANVAISLANTEWAAIGLTVFLEVGGSYQVVSIASATTMTVKNLGSTGNAAPGVTVPANGRATVAGATGSGGSGGAATPTPITSVITSNVSNLSAAPSANDGYTFLAGDVLALAGQTTPANNRLYTSNGAGVLSALATQPADGTLLITTKGTSTANVLWIYQPNSVTVSASNSGTLVGTYTTVTFAPDGLGLLQIGNEAVPRVSVAADAAFHDAWTYDMVGRATTAGRLKVQAVCWAVDGAKVCELNLRANVPLSATPTAGVVTTVTIIDRIEDTGGPYGDMRFTVVGTVLKLQIKNNQGGAVQFLGAVAFGVGSP